MKPPLEATTVVTEVGVGVEKCDFSGLKKWAFGTADWVKFRCLSDQGIGKIDINEDVDKLNFSVCRVILEAAKQSIQEIGAIWVRGRNLDFIIKKMQEAIKKVEDWSYKWGFRFSVDKTKTVSVRRIGSEIKIKLYNKELKRVKCFKFLGLWFDEKNLKCYEVFSWK